MQIQSPKLLSLAGMVVLVARSTIIITGALCTRCQVDLKALLRLSSSSTNMRSGMRKHDVYNTRTVQLNTWSLLSIHPLRSYSSNGRLSEFISHHNHCACESILFVASRCLGTNLTFVAAGAA